MHIKLIKNNDYINKIYLDIERTRTWVIGRANDCDIIIDSLPISRKHCTIYYLNSEENLGYYILDGLIGNYKTSSNGIFFKNTRIIHKKLHLGDIIQLPDYYSIEFTNGDKYVESKDTIF